MKLRVNFFFASVLPSGTVLLIADSSVYNAIFFALSSKTKHHVQLTSDLVFLQYNKRIFPVLGHSLCLIPNLTDGNVVSFNVLLCVFFLFFYCRIEERQMTTINNKHNVRLQVVILSSHLMFGLKCILKKNCSNELLGHHETEYCT